LAVVLAAGSVFTGCWGDGVGQSTPTSAPGTVGGDFGTVRVLVRTPQGEMKWCVWLAATPEQRERGLMEVTDSTLGGHEGMLFRFSAEHDGAFWMRNTPMPLSIAYFGADGGVVSSADMAPCADSSDCPSYPPDGPFQWALEVPQGRLADLGVTAGSTLVDTEVSC
jgi:uncharacterized membrane protein (UPF0127 family)